MGEGYPALNAPVAFRIRKNRLGLKPVRRDLLRGPQAFPGASLSHLNGMKAFASYHTFGEGGPSMRHKANGISDAADRFANEASLIRMHAKLCHERGAKSPFQRQSNYFKSESYNLINKQLSLPHGRASIRLIMADHNINIDLDLYSRIFYYGLFAIDYQSDFMDNRKRLLYSNQMHFAYLHRVPPEYLIGFLYQSGNSDLIADKVREASSEGEFVDLRKRSSGYDNQWRALAGAQLSPSSLPLVPT